MGGGWVAGLTEIEVNSASQRSWGLTKIKVHTGCILSVGAVPMVYISSIGAVTTDNLSLSL